jgi:hypothetical protein
VRFRVAAALLALTAAGCGSKSQSAAAAPAPFTCDNVVQSPIPAFVANGMVQDLGTLAVGTQNVQFTIPAGTQSFVIISQEVGRTAPASVPVAGMGSIPNAVVPTNLRGPDGTLYYDDFASPPTASIGGSTFQYPDSTGWLAIDQGFQPVVGALPFPTTSGGLAKLQSLGQVQPGTWSFTLNDWAFDCPFTGCTGAPHGGQYRVQVVRRPPPTSGALDVEVYLATDPTRSLVPTASAAAASPLMARWQQVLGTFLGNAGITLGQVTFHDLPPAVRAKYAPNGAVDVTSADPCGNLDQLFTNATVPSRGVQIFLADTLVDGTTNPGFRTAGVDGSIPGPSGFPGTITSGAIVGLEDLGGVANNASCRAGVDPVNLSSCGPDRVAYVTAHETGHWLGLYHPTESEGAFFDPIADTPPCPCSVCAQTASDKAGCFEVKGNNATTMMNNSLCVASSTCGGGENLMFWLFDPPISTGALSAQQGQVARLSPAVQ